VWIIARSLDGARTGPIEGDAETSAFEHASSKYASTTTYRVTELDDGG
jgi:hypothetical protein